MAVQALEGIIASVSTASGVLIVDNYLRFEQSDQDGEPVELYLFNRVSPATTWAYNSTDQIISYAGNNYTPIAMKRGNIRLDTNPLKTKLEITVPLTNPLARLFIPEPVDGIISLTIYRYHQNSFVTYWRGFLRGVKFGEVTAKLICGLKTTSLKRFGLMRKYQRNCGLPLYSTLCTVDDIDSANYVDGTINTVSGQTIDATIFSSKTDGWFVGGKFKLDDGTVSQKIVSHSGTVIKISRGITTLKAGDSFRAWAGCDHLKNTCRDKFNNKLNFGGQPYLPDKNPFSGDPVV